MNSTNNEPTYSRVSTDADRKYSTLLLIHGRETATI